MCKGNGTTLGVFPTEIWEQISTELLSADLSAFCALSRTSHFLGRVAVNVFRKSTIDLEVSACPSECNQDAGSSASDSSCVVSLRVEKKGTALTTSSTFTSSASLTDCLDTLLSICPDRIHSIRLTSAPSTVYFTLADKQCLHNVEDVTIAGEIPSGNEVHELLTSCPGMSKVIVADTEENYDYCHLWTQLSGTRPTVLALENLSSLSLSSPRLFTLPHSLAHLHVHFEHFNHDHVENLTRVFRATQWKCLQLQCTRDADSSISVLHRSIRKMTPIQSIKHIILQIEDFPLETLAALAKKCERVEEISWFGLHECAAAIVLARLLSDLSVSSLSRTLVLSGACKCVDGYMMNGRGVGDVLRRLPVALTVRVDMNYPEDGDLPKAMVEQWAEFRAGNATVSYLRTAKDCNHPTVQHAARRNSSS